MAEYPNLSFYDCFNLPNDFVEEALARRGARIKYEQIKQDAERLKSDMASMKNKRTPAVRSTR